MKRMWIGGVILLMSMGVIFGLMACASVGAADLSYADGGFTVEVKGELCRTQAVAVEDALITGVDGVGVPMAVAAVVTVGAPDAEGQRDIRVAYTAPEALSGVVVSRRVEANGVMSTTVARGEMAVTVTDGTYDGLWLLARVCLPLGDVVDVSPMTSGRQSVTLRSDGVEQVMVFSAAGGMPREVTVEGSGYRVQVTVEGGF